MPLTSVTTNNEDTKFMHYHGCEETVEKFLDKRSYKMAFSCCNQNNSLGTQRIGEKLEQNA